MLMPYNNTCRQRSLQRGSILLEGLIAILIFSMGIIALIGLQAASIKNASDAGYRTEAASLANEVIGQMWLDQANLASYAKPNVTMPTLPQGTRTVVVVAGSPTLVTVTVNWKLPGTAAQHTYTTLSQINVTNP